MRSFAFSNAFYTDLLKIMPNKNTYRLILLFGFLIFVFNINLNGQTPSSISDSPRIKNFGWSLRQFETEKEKSQREKKERKEEKKQRSTPTITKNTDSQLSDSTKPNENQNPISDNEETIRVETNLILNDVLVVNNGQAITNLRAKDFIITEDGVEQKAELFSFGDSANLPRSIVLIINLRRMYAPDQKNSVKAAQNLIDKLAPQDKMAIVTTDLKLVLDFTSDKELLKKTFAEISPLQRRLSGEARDYGTLMAVLTEMFDEKDTRPIVIFQTNSEESYRLKIDKDAPLFSDSIRRVFEDIQGERGYGFSDVIERIKRSRATVYSILPYIKFIGLPQKEQLRISRKIDADFDQLLGRTRSQYVDGNSELKAQMRHINNTLQLQMAMANVAQLSGGYMEFIEKPEDSEKVYNTIFAVIKNRYTIGYYSANQSQDKKSRTVKIEVRGHPEYTIFNKKEYLPASE